MQKAKTSRTRSLRNFSIISAAAVAGLVATKSAHAETSLTWEPAGSTTGIQEGVWDTTTSGKWYNSTASPTYGSWGSATTGSTAVFNANGAFVTSDGAGIYVDEITANGAYTSINGTNAITLSSGGPAPATITGNVTSNADIFIKAPLVSSNLVTFASQHHLDQIFLGGNNSFTGGIQLTGVQYNAENIILNSDNAINAGATLTANGATSQATYNVYFNNNINAGDFQITNTGGNYASIGNYSGSNTFDGTYTSPAATTVIAQSGTLDITGSVSVTGNLSSSNSQTLAFTPIGTLELSGSNSVSGAVAWVAGGFELAGSSGSITNSTGLTFSLSSFTIDNTSGEPVGGRLKSNATLTLSNSSFTDLGSNTGTYSTQSTSGILTLSGGVNWNMTSGTKGNELLFSSTVTRNLGANVVMTAASLGDGAYTSGYSNIFGTGWGSATNEIGTLAGTGTSTPVLPWVAVVDSNNTGLTAGSFATYNTANGLTALTTSQYDTNFSGISAGTGGATTNERVTSSTTTTSITLSAAQSVNSLLLDSTGGVLNLGNTSGSGPVLTIGNLNSLNNGWGGIIADGAANAINNGTLMVNGTLKANDLIVTTIGNLNIGATITNNGTLGVTGITKGGNGILTLSNTNSFTGNVYVDQGILNIAASGALGGNSTASTTVTLSTLATLEISGGIDDLDTHASLVFGSANYNPAMGYSSTGTSTYSEGPVVNGNLGNIYGDENSNTLSALINFPSSYGIMTIGVAQGGTLTLANLAPSGTEHQSFVKVGNGTLAVSNASFLGSAGSGGITVEQGTLAFNGKSGGYYNAGTTGSSIAVDPDSRLLLDSSVANNTNGNRFGSYETVTLYNGTLQVNGNATASTAETIASVTLGGGSMNKINAIAGASASATLTMTAFVPGTTNGAIIEGSHLGSAVPGTTAGDANIVITGAAPTLTPAAGTGTSIGITKNLIGDTNDVSVGNTFLTYNATNGFVPLDLSANYYQASGGSNTIANITGTTSNVYVTAPNDAGGTKTINSLNINTNDVTTLGGTSFGSTAVLTDTSSMLLASGSGSTVVNQYIAASNIWVTGDSTGAPGTLTLANQSQASTNTTINKYGIGTLILTDSASTTTTTNIYGGTVLAQSPNGAHSGSNSPTGSATSAIYVYGGGAIGGNTTIYSAIATLQNGASGASTYLPYYYAGAIAPGAPSNPNPYTSGANGTGTAGTLTVQNNVYLAPGSFLDYVLNTAGSTATLGIMGGGNSFLNITGQNGSGGILEAGTNETLVITKGAAFGGGTYQLASYGTFNDESQAFRAWNVVGLPAGYTYSFSATGTALDLNITAPAALSAPSISLTAVPVANQPQITNGTTGTLTQPVGSYAPSRPTLGTLTVAANANGSPGYTPSFIHGLNAASGTTTGIAMGYTPSTGFVTATETEIFLLKLDVNGTVASGAQDAQIVADINNNSPQTGLVASLPIGPLTGLGGTAWSIELSFSNPGLSTGDFGFNFAGYADDIDNLSISNVTVTDVAAVPEPASASLMALGVAGLLGVRRRSRKSRA